MERRELPLTALRSFEAVARHLSFSRAAAELGVTHGAVSRQIAALEETVGVKLFERGPTLTLTAAGERLFEGIAPAFDRIAASLAQVGRHDARVVLAVNAPPTFTMRWLIPRLSGFQRRHRDVDVRLATGTGTLRGLKMNEVDLAIRRLDGAPEGFEATPFLSGVLIAVCAPELTARQPIRRPADVAKHDLIAAATGAVGWPEWFAACGLALPENARFVRFEEMFFALQGALDGLGIALIPSALAVDDLAAGRLVRACEGPALAERDYCFVASPLASHPQLVKEFGDWLRHEGAEANRLADEVLAR